MNNENKSIEVKTQTKTSKLGSVFGWVIGVFFLLIGLIGFSDNSTIGTICILIGLFLVPLVNQKIKETKIYSATAKFLSNLSTKLSNLQPKPKFVCTNCGNVSNPVEKIKGSGWIELILYLFVVSIPVGLIYSIWRRTGRDLVCPKCKQPTLIPIDSPNGQKIMSNKNNI